ncbi:MAG: DinB family protein [Planctomycetota bacterium]
MSESASPQAASSLSLPDLDAIRGLDRQTLVGRLRLGVERFDPRVLQLMPEQSDRVWDSAEGVGEWSCRALLAHLMDAELVYGYRIRRTMAEDGPVLENFDEHAFLASPLYGAARPDGSRIATPMGAMAASIHALRQTLGAVLYQIEPDEWERRAMHPTSGPVTVHDLVAMHTWHVEHHAAFLNAKAERLLGPKPEGDACVPGGCGEGCGCVGNQDAGGTDN